MKLRNSHLAVVERSKVVAYLLNAAHPERLISALEAVATAGDVVEHVTSAYGEKYVVDGAVSSHTETTRRRMVRTVWIIDRGVDAPRLVTAYPGQE